ncbi:OLC1v1037702C1 [Oldenlandia corymbosa var. corymbosa]|uniref:OLC1v1037702C1 n=1 Tax=Oldenlandia corymbosa var. corymbosa TaxID=529605 RepID=A0AAV1D081_OLDCO|nr:OLC1v1037702C1 [Oldenlandia corymbosa var. corymbosa]
MSRLREQRHNNDPILNYEKSSKLLTVQFFHYGELKKQPYPHYEDGETSVYDHVDCSALLLAHLRIMCDAASGNKGGGEGLSFSASMRGLKRVIFTSESDRDSSDRDWDEKDSEYDQEESKNDYEFVADDSGGVEGPEKHEASTSSAGAKNLSNSSVGAKKVQPTSLSKAYKYGEGNYDDNSGSELEPDFEEDLQSICWGFIQRRKPDMEPNKERANGLWSDKAICPRIFKRVINNSKQAKLCHVTLHDEFHSEVEGGRGDGGNVESYQQYYGPCILPTRGESEWEKAPGLPFLPPLYGRPRGRPKSTKKKKSVAKRIIEVDGKQKLSKVGQTMSCSIYTISGHNKRKCPSRTASQGTQNESAAMPATDLGSNVDDLFDGVNLGANTDVSSPGKRKLGDPDESNCEEAGLHESHVAESLLHPTQTHCSKGEGEEKNIDIISEFISTHKKFQKCEDSKGEREEKNSLSQRIKISKNVQMKKDMEKEKQKTKTGDKEQQDAEPDVMFLDDPVHQVKQLRGRKINVFYGYIYFIRSREQYKAKSLSDIIAEVIATTNAIYELYGPHVLGDIGKAKTMLKQEMSLWDVMMKKKEISSALFLYASHYFVNKDDEDR